MALSMHGPTRQSLLTPLLLALLGVAVCLILLYGSLQRDLRAGARIDDSIIHSLAVRDALTEIIALHIEAESGKRGYAIASDPQFLTHYQDSIERLGPATTRLTELEASSTLGTGYADLIADASDEHDAFCRKVVGLISEGRTREARALIASGQGKVIMDRLRSLVAGLQSEEQAQLEQFRRKEAEINADVDNTLHLILLALGILVVGGGFASAQVIRRQASRIESDSNLFNAVIDPIILLNGRGEILSTNEAAQRKFGYSEEELVGTSVAVLLAEWPSEERLFTGLKRLLQSREHGVVRDYLFRRRNGTRFRGNVSVSIGQAGDSPMLAAIIRPHLGMDQLAKPADAADASEPTRPSSVDLLQRIRAQMDTRDLVQPADPDDI
jgi:PAS domain S-box-containing protein